MTFKLGMSWKHLHSIKVARRYKLAHSPVDADSTQVENTGGAHHHIQRDKDVTVEPAKKPGAADHLHKHRQAD